MEEKARKMRAALAALEEQIARIGEAARRRWVAERTTHPALSAAAREAARFEWRPLVGAASLAIGGVSDAE
eukprot:2259508-Prymnesium_polylepis.1